MGKNDDETEKKKNKTVVINMCRTLKRESTKSFVQILNSLAILSRTMHGSWKTIPF